jgi:hypothetical protein
MKKVIFKSEKKAKTYKVLSTKVQGCYNENEVLFSITTDDINQVLYSQQYEVKAIEI